MALVVQAVAFMQQYIYTRLHPSPSKAPDALKVGVLSTAQINAAAIVYPAESHPSVILYAIASRDLPKAQKAKEKYGFTKAYGSYDDLLEDPDVDIIYISTPNGLHYEWAAKSLKAGKHVLCEKPISSNASQAKALMHLAEEKGLILEEAFHWQFHPAAHAWRQLLDSKKYGKILRTHATMAASPAIPADDARWQFDLGGGSAMDMTYALSFTRYALHARTPNQIASVSVRPSRADPRVDEAMYAHLDFEGPQGNQVHSLIYTDMSRPHLGYILPRFWELPSIEVETEKAIIYFYNAAMPHVYHYITVVEKTTGEVRYLKQYAGGPFWGNIVTSTGEKGGNSYWSTYRWQLEAFVDAVGEKTPAFWIPNQDSVWQMESIDAMYQAAGLPVRPSMEGKYS